MAINYAKKYETKVDERFTQKSLSKAFTNNDYNWTGVSTIEIYSIPTVALSDYTLTGSTRYGSTTELQNAVQECTLTRDRAFSISIDARSGDDTNGVMNAGKAMSRQMDEVITPEIDTYVFAKMVSAAVSNGSYAQAAVTASNAFEKLLDGQAVLDDALVPTEGRMIAASPTYFKFIKLDDTFELACDIAMGMKINGKVGTIDGATMVKVPASKLPSNTSFIIAHPSATVVANKLQSLVTHVNPVGYNGTVIEGRVRYDAFVLNSKVDAIYVHAIALIS